ncbi:hypothetical protein KIM67_05225 [Flagellimonas sp. 389]|uniref:hypothetical protein n=1 Tax=Flagellimonas sp. 389 TaxID=2835862 RepID=UPI001BD355EB|nr:hypothetical protein [Flagellimonas sp. 389]MBS9461802.1 hypothetical protein [Flagellimonas sp. 389]
MKKKNLILLLIVLAFASSCSNDSDDDSNSSATVNKTPNLQATGSSANDILSNVNFDKLLIEITYVRGFRPTETSIDNFVGYLSDRTFKTDIEVTYRELPSPNEETLILDEIADLEEENRTAYNDGSTLAIYIYFADAPSDGDDLDEGLVTLGAVYRNTSMIIYESTIRSLASRSSAITVTDVETATLNHEFGHLFGLVNLGTEAINEHEDIQRDENGNPVLDDNGNPIGNDHCNVEGCLMRAELVFGSSAARMLSLAGKTSGLRSACNLNGNTILKMLESNVARGSAAVPRLDAECILDLQNNGGR